MVVDLPRSGSFHERNAHTSFLSALTSTACTAVLSPFLAQLPMSVLPLARRVDFCRPENRTPGRSAGVNSHTVSPFGFTSRTKFLLLVMSVLPLSSRSAYQ